MEYLHDPSEIERRSMEIIEQGLGALTENEAELNIIKRTIHTTGDFAYQHLVSMTPGAIDAGIDAIRSGCRIVTDTQMAYSGINKRALDKAGCHIACYISDEKVFKLAKDNKITRSMAAIDFAVQEDTDIFVIGNAPTALFRLGEYIERTQISPELVIGVPVGFVGAIESKEYLRSLNIPSITTTGTQGGSNVAAAIMNAIIYMAVGRA